MAAWDDSHAWFHGSPYRLTTLRSGSTITRDRHLATVFSHKPTIVSQSDDGTLKHNGAAPGFLYRLAETIQPGDVTPHPRSSMSSGQEWLTNRDLRLTLIGPTRVVEDETLTEREIEALQRLMRKGD